MREFYIYGFRNRNEFDAKSARTYDDERRRIESWLGDYMSFNQTLAGRAQFISVDSRKVIHNPLYKAFKASSFTDNDIVLHFFVLDLLDEEEWLAKEEIVNRLSEEYYTIAWEPEICDERIPTPETIDKKLKDYAKLGLLDTKIEKRKYYYRIGKNNIDIATWKEAINFFSEISPVGLVGSYLLDKPGYSPEKESFGYKHHYLLYAIDNEILFELVSAIETKNTVKITKISNRMRDVHKEVVPLKIYLSTQGGRAYLLCHELGGAKLTFYRIDNLKTAKKIGVCENWDDYQKIYEQIKPNLWGVLVGQAKDVVHLEITLRIEPDEEFMLNRLEREKRNGTVQKLSKNTYRYAVNTYDAMELMPWIRTFIGRVLNIESNNPEIQKIFCSDLKKMYEMYIGGEEHGR